MKKRLLFLVALLTFAAGCGSDTENPIPQNTCSNVSGFAVTQQKGNVHFELSDDSSHLYYQVSILQAQSSNNPDFGELLILDSTSETIAANSTSLYPGVTYLIYVRSYCDANTNSAWSAPQTFQFQDYCNMPIDLGYAFFPQGIGFRWQSDDNDTSYYQISYGVQGTSAANGTQQTVNGNYFVPQMTANTSYDFYVRAYCTSATGWSDWAGPFTYYSEGNQNLCTQPSNVQFTHAGSNAANFTWSYNGESQFEYALISASGNINNATIYSIDTTGTPTYTGLSTSANYIFYVRAVCANGNRTPWTTLSVHL